MLYTWTYSNTHLLKKVGVNLTLERDESTLQLLLDPSSEVLPVAVYQDSSLRDKLESISRNMIYHLHVCRWRLLGKEWTMKSKKPKKPHRPKTTVSRMVPH